MRGETRGFVLSATVGSITEYTETGTSEYTRVRLHVHAPGNPASPSSLSPPPPASRCVLCPSFPPSPAYSSLPPAPPAPSDRIRYYTSTTSADGGIPDGSMIRDAADVLFLAGDREQKGGASSPPTSETYRTTEIVGRFAASFNDRVGASRVRFRFADTIQECR